jgi:DNA-binding response OmpR family regulator
MALAAGADDCMRKPIDIRGLMSKLRSWLPPQ